MVASLPRSPSAGAWPARRHLRSERGGGSHEHLLPLSREGGQWGTDDLTNHLFYCVGNAVPIGWRNDIRAIECTLATDLLGGQVDALIHDSDIRRPIEIQVCQLNSCPV